VGKKMNRDKADVILSIIHDQDGNNAEVGDGEQRGTAMFVDDSPAEHIGIKLSEASSLHRVLFTKATT